jgi:hypothetical protein
MKNVGSNITALVRRVELPILIKVEVQYFVPTVLFTIDVPM